MFHYKQMRKRGVITKECSRCGGEIEEHRHGRQRYCKKCHAAHMRETRPKYGQLSDLQKKKAIARSYAHTYRDRGRIEKKPCSVCGSDDSQMHHEDYDKPTEVTWMCRPCHLIYHKQHAVKPNTNTNGLSIAPERVEAARR